MKRGNLCWYLEQQTDQFVDFVDICQESGCMIELACFEIEKNSYKLQSFHHFYEKSIQSIMV